MSLRPVKPRVLVRALEERGFRLLRKSKGSLEHPDGGRTTVPFHKGSDIGPGLLRKILRDAEIDPKDLVL
jgi:predicted RNA binding protein YcfA (HicA-like mRNA interferase family)